MNFLTTKLIQWALNDIKDPKKSKLLPALSKELKKQGYKKNGGPIKEPKRTGSQGWNDPELDLGPSTMEKLGYDLLLPGIGDISSIVGNTLSSYNSLLSGALAALAMGGDGSRRSGVLPDYYKQMALPAAALAAKGAMFKTTGDTIANRAYTYADTARAENMNARKMAMQLNDPQPGTFWATQNPQAKVQTRGSSVPNPQKNK